MKEEQKDAATSKKGAMPFGLIAIIQIVICFIYTGLINDGFWNFLATNPGYFAGLSVASIVLLLPVSAVIGFIFWFILKKITSSDFAFGPFWIVSLLVLVAFLLAGKHYAENQTVSAGSVDRESTKTPLRPSPSNTGAPQGYTNKNIEIGDPYIATAPKPRSRSLYSDAIKKCNIIDLVKIANRSGREILVVPYKKTYNHIYFIKLDGSQFNVPLRHLNYKSSQIIEYWNQTKTIPHESIEFAWIGLGNEYENGDFLENDYDLARRLYLKAGNNGEPLGYSLVGDLYMMGKGVRESWQNAARYYSDASRKNETYATGKLGQLFILGRGVRADMEKGLEMLLTAAKDGDAESCFIVGKLHKLGVGFEKNFEIGDLLLEHSGISGHPNMDMIIKEIRNKNEEGY